MKAKIIWEDRDTEDIKRAEELGMPAPEPVFTEGEIHFDLEFIHLAYLNSNHEIVIYLPSGNWLLKYDESLWIKIKRYLDSKNV